MRTQVRRQELESGEIVWWITEADGRAACRWLPLEPLEGALDRGGFADFMDARAHSLRVALVTIERVCARAQELRIDRSSRLVKVLELRKQRTSRRSP